MSKGNQKANYDKVTQRFLENRVMSALKMGYEKQKWIMFCEHILSTTKLEIYLYEARKTFSKYLSVTDGKRVFKVRFSNHKPNPVKEENKDCDFFVGRNHNSTATWIDAVNVTKLFFSTPLEKND